MNFRKLILPLVLVVFFVLQCFSSPLSMPHWLQSRQIEVDDEQEEEEAFDPRLHIPDSVLATWTLDSLTFYADSLLALHPIDSTDISEDLILVPTNDTIQAIVDTIFRKEFIKDSLIKAEIAFKAWFDSLPKKEQKKWIMEHVTIPAQRHRMDSILNRKDSLKTRKDSIISATPRVLETGFIPDSLWYKRIVMMTNDKYFGDFKPQKLDTSYNYHFYDYPFLRKDVNATWLGIAGSPVQYYNASKREEEENAIFFSGQRAWTYDASSLPLYNSKTPHTELAYWGTPFSATNAEEINLRLLTTQNITPALNATFELNKYGGGGQMQNQTTSAYHMGLAVNYLGKRYAAHGGWIHDHTTAKENGGFVRLSDIRDTTLKSRELEVNLSKAESEIKREVVFLNHSYRIPFGKDSLKTTTAYIGHTTELSTYKRTYSDNISNSYGRAFYNDVFNINPSKSNDSLGVMKLDNRFYFGMQPWKEDFFISKIDVGIGDKLVRYTDTYLADDGSTYLQKLFQNNVYAYAGAKGMVHQYFNWDAKAKITFAGYEAGDFSVDANAEFSFFPFRKARKSPVSIGAHFHTDLTEPDHYQQRMLLNHFMWENDFGKRSTTRISATLDIPHWKLDADVSYNILAKSLYFDNMGIARQSDNVVNLITASLHKEFVLWKFHLDNRALLQFSSDNNVVPVPLLALNLRYYLQFDVVKKVMQMQIGANGFFYSKWNIPSYNPELGVFYNQNNDYLGGCPVFDVFVNMQWKRACIFIKMENLGNGSPLKKGKDYFTANHYIHAQRSLKMGIFWPFYVKPGKIHKHDHGHGDGDSGMGSGASGAGAPGSGHGSHGGAVNNSAPRMEGLKGRVAGSSAGLKALNGQVQKL